MAWIKCSERMPDNDGTEVLVVWDDDAVRDLFGKGLATTACWDGVEWMYLHTWEPVDNTITHWQPLPEPPND